MPCKFAAFDIDGTLLRWQLFHSVVAEIAEAQPEPNETYIAATKAFDKWKRRTDPGAFYTYERATLDAWFALIKTITPAEYHAATRTVFEAQKDFTYRYTRDLIKTLQAQDYAIIAISGSHQETVQMIGDYYGFDMAIGSEYPVENGRFTGEEITPFTDKGEALRKIVAEHNLQWEDSYAVGDSNSDAKMLALVANPIAFNPDQNLLKHAQENNWKIVVERKNVAYELAVQNGTYYLQNSANSAAQK